MSDDNNNVETLWGFRVGDIIADEDEQTCWGKQSVVIDRFLDDELWGKVVGEIGSQFASSADGLILLERPGWPFKVGDRVLCTDEEPKAKEGTVIVLDPQSTWETQYLVEFDNWNSGHNGDGSSGCYQQTWYPTRLKNDSSSRWWCGKNNLEMLEPAPSHLSDGSEIAASSVSTALTEEVDQPLLLKVQKDAKDGLLLMLEQKIHWVEDAQAMLSVIRQANDDNTELPIFRPVKGNESEYEVWDERPADDMQQALNSIGVWLYEQIKGESEWTDKQFTQFILKQKKYQKLPEGHVFAELVDVLVKDDHPMTCEQVEAALAEILRQAQEDLNVCQHEKEELEAQIAELQSVIPTETEGPTGEETVGDKVPRLRPTGFARDDAEIAASQKTGTRNDNLFDARGRRIPPQGLTANVCDANYDYHVVQPEHIDYAERLRLAQEAFGENAGLTWPSVAEFQQQVEEVLLGLQKDEQCSNILQGPHFPICIPQMVVTDYGQVLEKVLLPAAERAYNRAYPNRKFYNHRKGELQGEVEIWSGSRHEQLVQEVNQAPVVGVLFPQVLQGYSINADREQMASLPEIFTLGGGIDTPCAWIMYATELLRDNKTPVFDMAALNWRGWSLYGDAYDGYAEFRDARSLGRAGDYCAASLFAPAV